MIRALPISVHTVDAETSESYFQRLATANSLSTESLWGYLRQLHGGLPIKRNAQLATTELEALGGLPPAWFSDNRQHHLLPIRCQHSRWKFAVCSVCSPLPAPTSGCTRCAHGSATFVTTKTGPICLRHKQWRYNGTSIDVRELPTHLAAEKAFRAHLTDRGISLETGEVALANQLSRAWNAQESPTLRKDADSLLPLFPETVRLAIALTDPEFVELLLDPRWSPSQHATLLSMTVTSILGHPERAESDVLWQTVARHTGAVAAAYAMVGSRRTSRSCTMQRAFFAAAYTHRACLLRHLDARHLPKINNPKPGRSAPSAQKLAALQQA